MSDANPAIDPIGYRCTGCGRLTKLPCADLSAIRAKGGQSCCPERNMVGLSDRIEELERMLGLVDDQRREWERHCKKAEAKLAKAVEALTPSGETKAAYIAEVKTDCPSGQAHTVSWTATKEIMKMIRHFAELKGQNDE